MQDDELTPYRTGADEVSAPVDLNAEQPVQHFAFGGIANPSQRPFLRGSDRGFLEARQKELDAFEQQRQAYNTALQDWQTNVYNPYVNQVNAFNAAAQQYNTEVYNPYKAQVDAYNAALQQYNKEVYDPYASQYAEYEKAINAYNAGDRTADYTGPAAPTLARNFDMTLPTQPKAFEMTAPTAPADFSMAAPVLPFKEEDVVKYQQEAAARARRDAGQRAVAIDVVSNPDQFNFGSMSVSNRFMAEGGPVEKDTTGQARKMMDELSAPEDDAALMRMLDEITSKGKLSKDQVLEAVDRVAAAGRGGDELLAYLSPESVAVLKKMGGAGTINPATGLPEFKGGVLGSIGRAVKRLFGRSDRPAAVQAEPQAERVPVAPQEPVAPVEKTPSAADLMKQLDEANAARKAAEEKAAADLAALREQQAAALKAQQESAAKAQQEAIAAALKADAEERAKAALPMSQAATTMANRTTGGSSVSTAAADVNARIGALINQQQTEAAASTRGTLTPAIARDLMQRSMTTGVPTAEFDKYGGYGAVSAMYNQGGGTYDLGSINQSDLQRYANTVAQTGVGNLSVLGQTGTPITPQALENMRRNGIDPSTIANAAQMYSAQALAGRTTRPTTPIPGSLSLAPNWSSSPNLSGGSATGVAAYGGVKPLDMSAFFKSMPGANWGSAGTGSGPRTTDQAAASSSGGGFGQGTDIPFQTATNAGQYGGIGTAINIVGPAMPGIGAVGPVGTANQQLQAIRPSNFFAQNQGASQGMVPGTVSAPYNPMAQYQGPSPLAALAANPNLAPGMLGGFQNAGMMVDRLGNRIFAPGLPPPGFAQGGEVSGEFAGVQGTGRSGGPVSDPKYLHRTPDAERLRLNQEEFEARKARKAEIRKQMEQNGATMFLTGTGYAPGGEFGGGTYRGDNVPITMTPTATPQRIADDSGLVPPMPGVPTAPFRPRFSDDSGLVPGFMPLRRPGTVGTAEEMLYQQRLLGFAKGGQVDIDAMRALVDASNMADEEEGPTVDDYAGEAKRMLASVQPTAQTPKMSRTRLPGSRGGAETPKEMGMQADALTTPTEFKPKKAKSAQAELRALAKQYALKQRAAENQARGLMQNTLGAPTLEQPTLTQEGLRVKRFQKGGEAKKADAGEVKEPSLFGVSSYATKASARMFPDQLGQDDQRDAARHMLAAATITRKYGPKAAELLGRAHEYTSNPHTFFSAFGVGKARDDLPYDLHNNQVGVELAARAKSQAELEKLVEVMAKQAQFKQTAGKPWIMSREQMQERERRFQEEQKRLNEPPEYKHGGAVKRHA